MGGVSLGTKLCISLVENEMGGKFVEFHFTGKLSLASQTQPTPARILKAIRAGLGWVWLARLGYA